MDHDDSIDLERVLRVVRERFLSILVVAAVCTVLAVTFAALRTPQYEATAILLTGQGKGLADVQSIQAIGVATESLARMSTDRVVAEEAVRRYDLGNVRAEDLAQRVSSEVPPDTQEILLTVRDRDRQRARQYANAIALTFSTLVEERAAPESSLSTVVWQRAITPTEPAGPSAALLVALGLAIGLALGVVQAFIRERLDRRWRSDADVEATLGIPVIALVPVMPSPRRRRKGAA